MREKLELKDSITIVLNGKPVLVDNEPVQENEDINILYNIEEIIEKEISRYK